MDDYNEFDAHDAPTPYEPIRLFTPYEDASLDPQEAPTPIVPIRAKATTYAVPWEGGDSLTAAAIAAPALETKPSLGQPIAAEDDETAPGAPARRVPICPSEAPTPIMAPRRVQPLPTAERVQGRALAPALLATGALLGLVAGLATLSLQSQELASLHPAPIPSGSVTVRNVSST